MVKQKRRNAQEIQVKKTLQVLYEVQRKRNKKVQGRQGILVAVQAVEQKLPQVRVRIISFHYYFFNISVEKVNYFTFNIQVIGDNIDIL